MGSITCIAWKGDTLVLGDMDGNLNFWDLKGRVSRYVSRTQVYYLAETKNLDIVPLEACHLAIRSATSSVHAQSSDLDLISHVIRACRVT